MQEQLIETFLDVLETRNFKRTAERLDITQSSVSARIKNLEDIVGARLFERGRRGAAPTAAGLRFEQHAQRIQASWDHARRDVSAGPGHDRVLRLAGQFSLMRSVLIDWVVQLRSADQNSAIDLQADYSVQIIRDLSVGTVDIGLMYSPQNLPDLQITREGAETFVMVSTQTGQLAGVGTQDYIRTGYSPYFDRTHNEQLPRLAASPVSVGYEELAVGLLERTGGASYLPKRLAETLCAQRAELRRVEDAPEISQPIYSAIHVRRSHDPAVTHALSVLRALLHSAQS